MTGLHPGTPKLPDSGSGPNSWVGCSQVQSYEHPWLPSSWKDMLTLKRTRFIKSHCFWLLHISKAQTAGDCPLSQLQNLWISPHAERLHDLFFTSLLNTHFTFVTYLGMMDCAPSSTDSQKGIHGSSVMHRCICTNWPSVLPMASSSICSIKFLNLELMNW